MCENGKVEFHRSLKRVDQVVPYFSGVKYCQGVRDTIGKFN